MNIEKQHTEKLLVLSKKITKRIELEIDPSLEKILSRLINLLTDIEKSNDFILIEKAEMAFVALGKKKYNLELATEIIIDLESRLSININTLSFLYDFTFRLNSPLSIILFGIAVNTILGHIVLILGYSYFESFTNHLNLEIATVMITALSGGWGAVISIGSRLHNLQSRFYDVTDHRILFLTGFFKPVIGVFFAIFVSALILSGFIPIMIPKENFKFFFAALAFISGFSERFAKDIISKAEKSILSKD